MFLFNVLVSNTTNSNYEGHISANLIKYVFQLKCLFPLSLFLYIYIYECSARFQNFLEDGHTLYIKKKIKIFQNNTSKY